MMFSRKRKYRAFYIRILGVNFITFIGPNPHGFAMSSPLKVAQMVFEQTGASVKTYRKPDGQSEVLEGLPCGYLVRIIDFYEDELFEYLRIFKKEWEFEGQIFVIDDSDMEKNQTALSALSFRE